MPSKTLVDIVLYGRCPTPLPDGDGCGGTLSRLNPAGLLIRCHDCGARYRVTLELVPYDNLRRYEVKVLLKEDGDDE